MSMVGLVIFGFFIGVAFSAMYKTYSERELTWNIILGVIASLQGKVLASLILLDNLAIPSQIVLALWVLFVLYMKRLLLKPRNIHYLGQ